MGEKRRLMSRNHHETNIKQTWNVVRLKFQSKIDFQFSIKVTEQRRNQQAQTFALSDENWLLQAHQHWKLFPFIHFVFLTLKSISCYIVITHYHCIIIRYHNKHFHSVLFHSLSSSIAFFSRSLFEIFFFLVLLLLAIHLMKFSFDDVLSKKLLKQKKHNELISSHCSIKDKKGEQRFFCSRLFCFFFGSSKWTSSFDISFWIELHIIMALLTFFFSLLVSSGEVPQYWGKNGDNFFAIFDFKGHFMFLRRLVVWKIKFPTLLHLHSRFSLSYSLTSYSNMSRNKKTIHKLL